MNFTTKSSSSGGPASKIVSCFSSDKKPSERFRSTMKLYQSGVEPHAEIYDNLQWSTRTSPCELISSLLHNLNRHACKRAIHRISINIQLLLSNFSAHQNTCLKINVFCKRCRLTHLIQQFHIVVTVVQHLLQETRVIQQCYSELSLTEEVKENLPNLGVFISYVWTARKARGTLQVCSVANLWSSRFLSVRIWAFLWRTFSTTPWFPVSPWFLLRPELLLSHRIPKQASKNAQGK